MTPSELETPAAQPLVTPVPLQIQLAATSATAAPDLARSTLAVFFMVGLAAAALWILRPFVPAILWATMVVVAMWPLMLRVQTRVWGKRWIAVTLMTAALLLAFAIPFSLAVVMIVSHTADIGTWAQSLAEVRLPPAPLWIEHVPVLGARVSTAWNEMAVQSPGELAQRLEPHVRFLAGWLVAQIGSVGMIIVQFLLTIVVSAILFARGEKAAAGLVGFFRRLAGVHGENVLMLAGRAIRSVALGVVMTALIQSVLGGMGLALAGVPLPGLLTALMFVLAVAQIGPGPVLIGAVIWMYWTSESAWAPTALLVWCVFVGALDNVLRPILIKRGGDLPLLIVFAGVVGGLLSFGLVGIFLGPVVLAIVYTLLKAWASAEPQCDQGPLVRPSSLP